ncbi:MAG: hypothetical protein CSA65_09565 [Proteobacteria bacterium]|nr:MAG: hypothetical protein CSB49_01445 [Pseudomonadota bacterium]PIE17171.1 MAG: hypothetical protein CSA65_09565 [Pseudomonadota bacterium]
MPSLRHILLRRQTLLWAALLIAVASGLCFVPLFNVLGYEFCLLLGLVASVAGAHLGARLVAIAREADESLLLATHSPHAVLASLLGRAVLSLWSLLTLPLAIIALNALRVRNCDLAEGLAFFAMMPIVSAAIAACVGVLWGLALPHSWLATLAAWMTVLVSLAWGVYRFYAEPAVFGYDPFAGYFPGTLYDEDIAIRAPFYWSRLQQLCWLGAALLIAPRRLDVGALRLRLAPPRVGLHQASGVGERFVATLPIGALLIGAITLTAYRAELGYAVDAEQIHRDLGAVRYTRHFEIVHSAQLSRDEVNRLAEDHELRYAQLSAVFGAGPRRIRSYIFTDAEQKRRLMGAARVYIAKPWRREVYLQEQGFPHRVLKHELAHVFAGRFGDPLFRVSFRWRSGPLGLPVPHFNVGLIEGVAVAADWRSSGELDGHQRAAALFALKLAPPIEGLFGLGFLAQAGSRAYALAGSFCRYLLDRYGMAKLGAVYRSAGDFRRVYGKPLGTLIAEWRAFIAKVKVPPAQLALAAARYRRPSILRRVCAHEIANLLGEVRAANDGGDRERAVRILERVCRFEPENPAHLIGLMYTRAAAGGPSAGLAMAKTVLSHRALSKPQRRSVLETIGDWRTLQREPLEAARAYGEAAKLPAGPGGRRMLTLKRWALEQRDPLRRLLLAYLITPPGEPRSAARDVHRTHQLRRLLDQLVPASSSRRASPLAPYAGLGGYLLGKQLWNRDEAELAIAPLERALRRGLPAGDIRAEALRTLALCQYERARFGAAAETTRRLLRQAPSAGLRGWARDWLARIHWRRTGKLPRKTNPLASF